MNETWNLPPAPLGFQGLRDDLPLEVYEQHLPHWRQDGATYFVTFRLNDSLPQPRLRELDFFRAKWQQRHPPPHSRDDKEEHLYRAIQYIGRNPKNAGLSPTDVRLCIRPSWVECGWRFEVT
jgi:hypothetical protein